MRATSSRRACSCTGPPARRIAPSTPPPPSKPLFAAFTTASTCCSTMSPPTTEMSIRNSLPDPMGSITTRSYPDGDERVATGDVHGVSDLLAMGSCDVVWVDLGDPSKADLVLLAEELGLHHLAVEDALDPHQRDKYVHYEQHVFLVAHGVSLDVDAAELRMVELDVFIGDRWMVTCHQGAEDVIERVVQ